MLLMCNQKDESSVISQLRVFGFLNAFFANYIYTEFIKYI